MGKKWNEKCQGKLKRNEVKGTMWRQAVWIYTEASSSAQEIRRSIHSEFPKSTASAHRDAIINATLCDICLSLNFGFLGPTICIVLICWRDMEARWLTFSRTILLQNCVCGVCQGQALQGLPMPHCRGIVLDHLFRTHCLRP